MCLPTWVVYIIRSNTLRVSNVCDSLLHVSHNLKRILEPHVVSFPLSRWVNRNDCTIYLLVKLHTILPGPVESPRPVAGDVGIQYRRNPTPLVFVTRVFMSTAHETNTTWRFAYIVIKINVVHSFHDYLQENRKEIVNLFGRSTCARVSDVV